MVSASGPTHTRSQQKRKLEVQTWELTGSAAPPIRKSDTKPWVSLRSNPLYNEAVPSMAIIRRGATGDLALGQKNLQVTEAGGWSYVY